MIQNKLYDFIEFWRWKSIGIESKLILIDAEWKVVHFKLISNCEMTEITIKMNKNKKRVEMRFCGIDDLDRILRWNPMEIELKMKLD